MKYKRLYLHISVAFGWQSRRLQDLIGFSTLVPNILHSFNTHGWLFPLLHLNDIIQLACGRLQYTHKISLISTYVLY